MFETRFTAVEKCQEEKGTIIKGNSKTRADQAEDTDIYRVLEKYTNSGIVPKLKNVEPMYIDTTLIPNSLQETLQLRQNMEDYFKNMTAQSRKRFGDNFEEFYEDYKNGNWDRFKDTGVLTEAQMAERTNAIENAQNTLKDKIKAEVEAKYTDLINKLGGATNENNSVG